MQDDFTVTPSSSDESPNTSHDNEPASTNGNTPQPVNVNDILAQLPTNSGTGSSDPQPSTDSGAAPATSPVDSLASLAPSDPGPIPPATSMNFTPGQVSGPGYGAPDMGGQTGNMVSTPVNSPRKKWLMPTGIVAALVVILAAAYYFSIYLPSTPSQVYSASLSNSGLALDKLIQYSQKQQHASYSTTSFTGTLQAKSPGASYDVSMNGAVDKNANTNIQLNADVMGEKLNANVLGVKAAGNTAPDIYVQVTGVKSMLDSLGLNSLDKIDGQWIVIDHTLVETYLSSLAGQKQPSTGTAPSYAAVEDALSKVQTVNKKYLFSTDQSTAVFTSPKFIAKETSGGRSLDHYKVSYSKEHLNAYLTAVGQALNSSQLNTWYKGVSGNKNLSDGINISSWQKKVNSAPSNYSFDMWADTKTKLVAKISFTDPSNKASVFSVEQNYTGGTTYPFEFGFTGKDGSGSPEAASLGISVNTNTNKVTLSLTSNDSSSDGMTNITANVSTTPSNTPVKVTVPKNAESFTNLLLSLGLGSDANNTSILSESTVHSLTQTK